MRRGRIVAVSVCALAVGLIGCDEAPPPTAPTIIFENIGNPVINNGTAPGTTPGTTTPPAPGQGLTPTTAKVTIIGGNPNGVKVVAGGASVPLTFTRFARNAEGRDVEVPGNPTDAVTWRVVGATDRGSPVITDASCGRCVQNYNREVLAPAAGPAVSFSVTASQGSLEATAVIDVR